MKGLVLSVILSIGVASWCFRSIQVWCEKAHDRSAWERMKIGASVVHHFL